MAQIASKCDKLNLRDDNNILTLGWHMIQKAISDVNCHMDHRKKGIFPNLVSLCQTSDTTESNRSQASGSQDKNVYFSDYWYLVPVGVLILMVYHYVTRAACASNHTSPCKYRFLLPTKMLNQQHKLPREFKQNSDCRILSSYNSHYKLDSNPFETAKHGKVSAMTFFHFRGSMTKLEFKFFKGFYQHRNSIIS